MRWCEEVILLKEEMRRFKAFMQWQANWWETQVRVVDDSMLKEGLDAYASRQGWLRESMRSQVEYLWRFCADWDEKGAVPTDVHWFDGTIKPKDWPLNAFDSSTKSGVEVDGQD
jgi:hypothetical protein